MADLSERLWKQFGSLAFADLPGDVAQVARQSILDWYGCALAGSREPLSAILRAELVAGEGPASIVGTDQRADPLVAALVNGAAGHALDYDDTNTIMGGHPTVPLFPAVLALSEEQGRSGADALTAFVVGLEVEGRVGSMIGPAHYAKGWHQTSTVGVFGAAAASAWLLDLDDRAFGHALGLAASTSAGLKANFGTMTKPFHAGNAAERGLLAARLAARGYTSNPDAIGASQGLAQAAGSGSLRLDKLDRYADAWLTPATLFKYHAACHLTHAGIEATLSLLADQPVVEALTLTVNPSILDVCGIPEPATGLEAKFSLRGTLALAMCGVDTTDVGSFSDGLVHRGDVRAAMARVTVTSDEALPVTASRVVVESQAERREAYHDSGIPATDLDVQGARLRTKFLALAEPVVGHGRAVELADAIGDMGNVADVRALSELVEA